MNPNKTSELRATGQTQPVVLTLATFMDCLTHDVGPDEWRREVEGAKVVTPDGSMSLLLLVMDDCLEDPQLSKWKNAFVWRLVEKYDDQATVEFPAVPVGVDSSQLEINAKGDWECRGCGHTALMYESIGHERECPALIW